VSFVATAAMLPALLLIGVAKSHVSGGLDAVFPAGQLVVDPVAQWSHPALPFRFVATLIVLTCFTYIAAPWYGQKMFSAKDEHTAFAATAWSAVLVFGLYGSAVLAAAYFRASVPTLDDPQLAVPQMVRQWLPPGLRGVGLGVLFAAALTTLGGVWTAMAAMAAADFGWAVAGRIAAQRMVLIAVAVASWLGGTFLVDDILNRLILANIPVAALAFSLLAGFYWKRATTAGAWASVIVGIVWGTGSFLIVGEEGGYTWPWAMYGIPLIFATGALVSVATHDPARSR
jgi:solute:Na+ symporter, SSS family